MQNIAERTTPQRAAEITRRLRRPANAVSDRGIDLRAGKSFAVRGYDSNLFFVPQKAPDTAHLQRMKAERQKVVPVSDIKISARILGHFPFDVPPQDGEIRRPAMADICRLVCDFYKIRKDEMMSARRDLRVCRPRQVAMWLCRQATLRSLPDIGRFFGGRDHTTALSGNKRIEQMMATNHAFRAEVMTVIDRVRAAGFFVPTASPAAQG